jgi:hypothetical protein
MTSPPTAQARLVSTEAGGELAPAGRWIVQNATRGAAEGELCPTGLLFS